MTGHLSSTFTNSVISPMTTLALLVNTNAFTPLSCDACSRFFVPPTLILYSISFPKKAVGEAVCITMSGLSFLKICCSDSRSVMSQEWYEICGLGISSFILRSRIEILVWRCRCRSSLTMCEPRKPQPPTTTTWPSEPWYCSSSMLS